ncbi:hypothetical protein EYR38_003496 [Pleurotus pulmonarius]|nr:hypothetical protein EYR38_003496 [Pleurotus pulmonarius]
MYFKPPFIDTFPALKRVDFSFYKNLRASEMARFLNSHGKTIEELTLATNIDRPSDLTSFFNSLLAETIPIFSISALQLPLLRSLSIAWNLFEGSLDVPFQQLWSNVDFPVLDTLKLTSPSMDNAHLAFFCDVFKRSSASHIRRLELPFTFMNAETLDLLSEAFPNLHTLILSTTWLSNPAMTNPPWDIDAFAAEMEHREYPTWALYDLEISPSNIRVEIMSDRFIYRIMEIAASRIPSVRSFCGSGHMVVPRMPS